MDSGSGDSTWLDPAGFEATRRESRALRQRSEQARASARATRDQVRQGRPWREILHDSAFARLRARQETLAVIEQAKGIVMAQQRCGPDEAFDLLRRVSQRVNIKLHVLAAQIVEHIAASDNYHNVTPITVGATRHLRPEARAVTRRMPSPGDPSADASGVISLPAPNQMRGRPG